MEISTKPQVIIFKSKDFRGNINTFYSAKIENTTYQCLSLEDLNESIKNHKSIDVDASSFYGIGINNGD